MLRLLRAYSLAQQTKLRRMGFVNRWIETSVGKLRYLERTNPNSSPTWIFLHGFASQATDWTPLLARLQGDCGRMIAIDLPGHGASHEGVGTLTPQNVLDGVYDAMDHLLGPDEHAIIVANSMGGLGAVRMAQAHPEKIDKLILLSPFGAPMGPHEREAVLRLFEVHSHRDALTLLNRLFVRGVANKHALALALRALLGQPHLQDLVTGLRSYSKFLQDGELQNLPPTLLIWGQADTILPATGRDFFSRELRQVHMVEPQRFGHAPFLDQAEGVAQVIREWLAH